MGMDLAKKKGNIVIDELHFTSSLYLYKELEKQGVELRIVKHRNWAIDPADMDKAIDRNTRMVSLALVSNVNGFMHDCKAVSDLAHARGAYVFADIIQAVGAVPVDVKALGIDFAATGTYKWIMGERGFGFLYVKEDAAGHGAADDALRPPPGHQLQPRRAHLGAAARRRPLRDRRHRGAARRRGVRGHRLRATRLGLDKIRAHATQLTDRLQSELPPLGYPAAHPARQPDADRRLRAEGRRRHQQGAAGRQGHGDGRRQREPAAAVGVGVQHPRRHRPGRRGPGRTPQQHRPRLTQWQL